MNIIPTKTIESSVVIFLLTNSPISVLFLARITSGIIGRGIIRLNMTWLYTKMLRGSRPKSIAIVVGITLTKRVINLLNQTFTFFPNNPSIIAWPASVPTTDDAIPDEKSN